MIGIFEKIDQQSQSPHRDDLPDPPTNWRAMLIHPHAVGFKKAEKIEYQTLIKKGT